MIKIAICHDRKAMVNQIENTILELSKIEKIPADTDVFYCGKALEKEIAFGTQYDLFRGVGRVGGVSSLRGGLRSAKICRIQRCVERTGSSHRGKEFRCAAGRSDCDREGGSRSVCVVYA